jgi:phage tail-like protein
MECSGLEISSGFAPRPGADSTAMPKLPRMEHVSSISLMHGLTGDFELAKWYRASERKSGGIIVRDGNDAEKARWNFREAYATKYFASSAVSDGNEMTIDILHMVLSGLEKAR